MGAFIGQVVDDCLGHINISFNLGISHHRKYGWHIYMVLKIVSIHCRQ